MIFGKNLICIRVEQDPLLELKISMGFSFGTFNTMNIRKVGLTEYSKYNGTCRPSEMSFTAPLNFNNFNGRIASECFHNEKACKINISF